MTAMQGLFNRLLVHLWACTAGLVWVALAALPAFGAEPVRIGVLAFRSKAQTFADWQPMVAALKQAMPERDFLVEPYDLPGLDVAVASRQLDFVLTNSGHYVLLKRRYDLSSPLATLVASENGAQTSAFGGVIFARSDAAHINVLGDLSGKSVGSVSRDSLGGFQMQVYEMSQAGVPLPGPRELVLTGMPQDTVVDLVLSGRVNAGFVRSGVLEAMARENKLDLSRVKIINRQNLPGFPSQVSTRLYPEWPFVALPHIDEKLARHVTAALFLLKEQPANGQMMGKHSFVVPADYTPVEDVLRELRLPPFEAAPRFTLQDVWMRYIWQVLGALLAMALIVMLTIRLLWMNKILGAERLNVVFQKQKLEESEVRFRTLVERSPEPILVHRLGKILYANVAAIRMFGASSAQALLERPTRDLIHPDFRAEQSERMKSITDSRAITPMVESKFLRLDGTPIDVEVQGTLIAYDDEPAIHISVRDITERKQHQKQLEHIAHFDALTQLPNRTLLSDRLHQGMAQALRRGQRLVVAFLDLDGFKKVNDDHGHDVGDVLLTALASRMRSALRDGDTLARMGGDEFVAVLVDLPDVASSVPMLTRLLDAAAQAVAIGDVSCQVSASLGVAFYPQNDEVDADTLLRQADQAMYQAKLAGKNRYHVFDTELDRSVRGHHESLDHIALALKNREFVLYFQPKVNMRTGKVIGAEALIRWQHPQRGLLAPAAFLPAIEDHFLAVEIGEWVIDTALQQVEMWRTRGLDIPVSVNVGARQLQQSDFVERLKALLAAHPTVQSTSLQLEVLETSALEDVSGASDLIETCRRMGVSFALDDFGTGYSSLTYLRRLPANLLKIDQSFVRDMLDDPDDLAILKGIIGLAQAFKRDVIAEGVETIAHGEMLLALGCDLAQGYGIARPMPAGDLPHWCAAWMPHPAWAEAAQTTIPFAEVG